MSSPDRRRARGFTMLECTVALLVFTLLVVGLARLAASHDRLLASMEGWLADEPTWFVDRADDELLRAIGAPARLVALPPFPPGPPPEPGSYALEVVEAGRELSPASAEALVVMTALETEP